MKITILLYGTLGDVQPYVALAAGLQEAGHETTVAADPSFAPLIRSRNIGFAPVAGNPADILEDEDALQAVRPGEGLVARLAAAARFTRTMRQHWVRHLNDTWRACQRAEALVFSMPAIGGYHVAEKLKIPAFAAMIAPFTRSRAHPSIVVSPRFDLGDTFNFWTHKFTEQALFWQSIRSPINEWRQATLKLPPVPVSGYFEQFSRQSSIPTLYCFSPTVFPPPPDWSSSVHVTGYWFLDRDPEWKPARELTDFLAAGPPPVYVGFGSMTSPLVGRTAEQTMALVIDALHRAGQRGIVATGWDRFPGVPFPETVLRIDQAPHDWLFPQVAMTIHHGGAGTTGATLRAGLPSVVTPFFWDQPFWGQRVAQLGAGDAPIPNKELTAEKLACAIRRVLGNPEMRARARAIGARIRREDGVANAVGIIQQRLKRSTT